MPFVPSIFRRACGALAVAAAVASSFAAGWEETVPPSAPGNFPEMRAARAQYGFGWNGGTVATAQLHFHRVDDQLVLEGSAETVGFARGLLQFAVQHYSAADARTLRPIRVKEVENRRSKQFDTEATYTADQVSAHRIEQKDGKTKTSDRAFEFPNVMSLNSALLYLRSKPLEQGSVERIVVFPARSPYLCTLTVLGREHVNVPAGSYDAIKLDVKLSKIADDHTLKPHKKFKRATVWISNDSDRLLLRIEGQIFLGNVFAELQSVQFESAKP